MTNSKLLVFLATAIGALFSGARPPLAAQTPPKRLVMISVDGLRATTLANADRLGLRIPNLREFRDHGAAAEGLQGVFPTVTYPSHTTMVTGRRPSEHGIISNNLFDPEDRLNAAWFWYSELIKTPTLWEAARSAGLTTAAVSWPVTAGAQIDHNLPEFRTLRTSVDVLDMRAVATPGLVREFEKARGAMRIEGEHFDSLISQVASFIIGAHKPNLLLVHLVDLDHDQHNHGPESPEALRTLETIDGHIGELRKAVADAGLAGETRWIVLSDHGFYPVEKEFRPDAMLVSLGLAGQSGDPKSWRVATMRSGGSTAFFAKDPKDQEAQALVERTLRRLQTEGGWGIDRILDAKEMQALGGFPGAFAAISMQSGWMTAAGKNGPWAGPSASKGTHGYLAGPRELDCTFVAFGPGVPSRRIPRAELTDVARTAAALLGVRLDTAGGHDLLASPSSR